MARKNLLEGLVGQKLPAGNSGEENYAKPSVSTSPALGPRGAIGAISRSIENLKSHAEIDLDPDFIDPPPVADRLGESDAAFSEFLESFRSSGQQVPILVRPHPQVDGRYQVAYGRRRIRAAKALGRRVRAIVKSMSDADLVIAQGQENSQRADLTFIERALYAYDLEHSGISRDVIMKALGVDKTGLSRLISVVEQVPSEIVRAIGSSPKAGRDRWLEFAVRLKSAAASRAIREVIADEHWALLETDDRFTQAFLAIGPKRPPPNRMKSWKAKDGTRVARYRHDDRETTISLDRRAAPEFGDFVIASLDRLYEAYLKARES